MLATMIRKPTSMIGAMTRVENVGLLASSAKREYAAAIQRDSDLNARIAVDYLLSWVYLVELGRQTPSRGVEIGKSYFDVGPDNLVSRIAYAALVDARDSEPAPTDDKSMDSASRPADVSKLSESARPVMERFAAMREIIESTPADRTTLHNQSLVDLWGDIVKRHVERPDVAASIALRPPYANLQEYRVGPVRIHLTSLPMINARIGALANALAAEGHEAEAKSCRDWMARTCLGLMLSEQDASTRLLCSELISQNVKGSAPAAAESLDRFRSDYLAAAAAAPIDHADQDMTNKPSVAPVEYERAVGLLAMSAMSWAAAAGSAGAMVVVLVVGPIAFLLRRRRKQGDSASDPSNAGAHVVRPWYVILLASIAPAALVCILCLIRLRTDRYFSQTGGVMLALFAAAIGAASALGLAAIRTQAARVGRMSAVGVMILLAIPFMLPMSSVTGFARTVSLALGSEWLVIPLMVALVSTAGVLCGASIRTLISSTAVTWCLLTCFALGLYLTHAAFDRQYQSAAAVAHADEVAARLGPDWQKTYLRPALEHYDLPRP